MSTMEHIISSDAPLPARRRRRRTRALGAAAVLAGALVVAGGSPVAAGPYCGITWGSLAKQDPDHTTATIREVRAGRHGCFDRLVIDLGPRAHLGGRQDEGYVVRYVDELVEDPSGRRVALAGGARLEILVRARAVTDRYRPTYAPADRWHAVDVGDFRTFRQVAFLGTFEAQTQFGLGVRARLPFRVFELDGPGDGSRLVIDVAHQW